MQGWPVVGRAREGQTEPGEEIYSWAITTLFDNKELPENMLLLLTLTWCHRTPADTPTRPCIKVTSNEYELDNIACAGYIGRQGGADSLVSDHNVALRGSAALLHQGCPVAVRDCQVVVTTGEMIILYLESSEF